MKRFETMRAEMQPDTCGGESCEEIAPRWFTYAEGDKDGDFAAEFGLEAKHFPPGTSISVQEPCCPNCEEGRAPTYDDAGLFGGFASHCDCGFDWDTWTRETYG